MKGPLSAIDVYKRQAIYDILGAYGIIRVDYIITEGEKINLLEVNTTQMCIRDRWRVAAGLRAGCCARRR